jgi:hypothetical protein
VRLERNMEPPPKYLLQHGCGDNVRSIRADNRVCVWMAVLLAVEFRGMKKPLPLLYNRREWQGREHGLTTRAFERPSGQAATGEPSPVSTNSSSG